ncbi:MAG: hypothetical protein WHS65_08255 [Melioribacteraceae bacterium]
MNEKEFTIKWIEKIKQELKNFPNDFNLSSENKTCELPGKNLLLTPPLFDSYEIVDNDGNIVFHVNNFYEAKYIIYSNRNKPKKIFLPITEDDIKSAVESYENYLDNLLRNIEKDFKENFPKSKNFPLISTQIFNSLNLVRL